MKIKSAKSFRRYVWKKPEGGNQEKSIDYNFIGSYATKGNEIIHGFFKMYHGIKPDIAGYLPSILKIAEDGQAIYEFIQNAVDCNSTHFYIFYNEKYFLAINNGKPFDIESLQSILNIAQTTKKDPESIGRFGIGFKLAHRLVGKNEGTEELVKQYKGPVLFSWSRLEDLQGLLNNEQIEPLIPSEEMRKDFINAPYLLKLILTNFPTEPNERVKDLNYRENVLFPQDELNELIGFLNENFKKHSESLKMNVLNQGSLFFIKLGEGKNELLDKDYNELVNGIQYSMNTLKRLQKVYINNEDIGKIPLTLEEGIVKHGTEVFERISPEYKDFDIKYAIGYNKIKFGNEKSYEQLKALKEQPNFYKYFPMGDEVNKFGFIVHCDSFSNEANRRKLQQDNINKHLFPEIADFIVKKLENYQQTNRVQFLNLYTCILFSDIPERENNKWLRPIFYDTLLNYLQTNIPTKGNKYSNNAQNVKVNEVSRDINLSDFGLGHIQWFEWDNVNDKYLLDEASNPAKLGIESWDIRDIVENADLESINNWINKSSIETYDSFLTELESSSLRQKTKERVCNLKLFRFSNEVYYSFNDIVVVTYDNYKRPIGSRYSYSNVILHNNKTYQIKSELEKIRFISSVRNVSEYPNIYSCIAMPAEKTLYDLIAEQCKTNTLTAEEKKRLFLNFITEETKFDGIAEGTLKDLCLFLDGQGIIKPLCELVDSSFHTPAWATSYKIKAEESFTELKHFLIPENELYKKIIISKWDDIITRVTIADEFYRKVEYYYGLDDSNYPLRTQRFVFAKEGFLLSGQTFFNSEMNNLGSQYIHFQNAIQSLFGLPTPDKIITPFLLKEPFKVDGSKFCGRTINNTSLDIYEIKAVLSFCKLNNEQFFKNCIVKKDDANFTISPKSNYKFQISSPDKEAREFIDKYCVEKLYVLPFEFAEFKDEDGIIRADDLHCLILDCIEVNDHKETLVNIVKYRAKYQLLQKISEFSFSSEKKYNKDDYECKILELACAELKDNDYPKFKEKVKIQTANETLNLSDIPPFENKIIIEGVELSLSEILPDTYQNSSVLSNLTDGFIKLGLSKVKLHSLFGVNSDVEPDNIFEFISDGYTVLQNAQQLAFLLLYISINDVNFDRFKVETLDGNSWELKYSYYIQSFSFIDDDYLLKNHYSDISKILDLPVKIGKSENQVLFEPYLAEDEFVCPCIKSDLSVEEKTDLIEFIYKKWKKGDVKSIIISIDWSKINDTKTETLLGFNPIYSVFPNKYACEKEQLPGYLIEWIGTDKGKINFIADLGVWTENSVIVDLRKYLKGEFAEFSSNRLAQEIRFNNDETMLFSSFEWMKENEYQLSTNEQYETFIKVVDIINENRSSGDLIPEKEYDYESIEENSTEWGVSFYQVWKEKLENNFSIYLFDGKLPKKVGLDEIKDYIFYRFNEGEGVIDGENNIYINTNANIKKELQKLASADDNDFTFEFLWDIFGSNADETDELRKKVALLESQLQRKPDAQLGAGFDNSISKNDQIETNREAKEIVRERLVNEGFSFTHGIDGYSTIDGVVKDEIEFPLVVKSYKWRDEPLKIGANEWLQLMKPNSMFWVHFGNRELGCLKLYELLRKQDKLTISFSTENLDYDNRLFKFAELLHYFGNVHFDFSNIKPDNYSTAENLEDYRFDERKTEDDLSNDSDNLL